MPLDPELAAAVAARAASQPAASDLAGMRAGFSQAAAALPRPAIDTVEHLAIPREGAEVPVRLYRPTREVGPLLIFLHGGGWMFGDLDTHDAACRHLAKEAGCAVAAVAYRLAPEHPFPAGLQDCDVAARWLLDNAASLGMDAHRVAIGGESAGANLAAVLARKLSTRRGAKPMLQLLVHPAVDFRFEAASIDAVPSPGLTRDALEMVRGAYLRDATDITHPDASPALADDLAGAPSAIVLTVEVDPLRDEGEAYALRLAAAGVETTLVRVPGLAHGFMVESAAIGIVGATYARLGRLLRRAFADGG